MVKHNSSVSCLSKPINVGCHFLKLKILEENHVIWRTITSYILDAITLRYCHSVRDPSGSAE